MALRYFSYEEKRMKKVLVILMMAAAVLFATSCTKKAEDAKSAAKLTKETIKVGFVYIGTINDEGYTQAHDKGRLALNDMGIKTAYIENVAENADCEKAIRDLIDQGCNVVYTTSFGFMDWTIKVAADHPEVYFGHCSGYKLAPNVATYFGKIEQPRYLSGIVAGLKTKTNKIGYVAAMPIPECIRGINAFALGVQSVNPKATVEVMWTNTWFDPAVEKQAALELLNKGCDVMAQHQDSTATQVAAQEKGAFAVGYNTPTSNAAPKAYLTAPLFNWATFYTSDVQALLDGKWTSARVLGRPRQEHGRPRCPVSELRSGNRRESGSRKGKTDRRFSQGFHRPPPGPERNRKSRRRHQDVGQRRVEHELVRQGRNRYHSFFELIICRSDNL